MAGLEAEPPVGVLDRHRKAMHVSRGQFVRRAHEVVQGPVVAGMVHASGIEEDRVVEQAQAILACRNAQQRTVVAHGIEGARIEGAALGRRQVNAQVLEQRLAADADVANAPKLIGGEAHKIGGFVGLCRDHELPVRLGKGNPRDLDAHARMGRHEGRYTRFEHRLFLALRSEGMPHGERHLGDALGPVLGGFSLKATRQQQHRDQQGRGQTTQGGRFHAKPFRPTSGFSVDRLGPEKAVSGCILHNANNTFPTWASGSWRRCIRFCCSWRR